MTTTAHEDQFTVAPTDSLEVAMHKLTQALFSVGFSEAKTIAEWLDRHGYREIAARIRAGEHLA